MITIVLPCRGDKDALRVNKNLIPSIDKFLDRKAIKELILVCDDDTKETIVDRKYIRFVNDDVLDLPDRPGWFRQQSIKLKIAKHIETDWYLSLDSDCYFIQSSTIDSFFVEGKAIVNTGKCHDKWWKASSLFLGKDEPEIKCSVTPMLLHTKTCKNLIEEYNVDDAINSKADCTEYTLYWTYLGEDNLELYHFDKKKPLSADGIWWSNRTFTHEELTELIEKQFEYPICPLSLAQSQLQKTNDAYFIIDKIASVIDSVSDIPSLDMRNKVLDKSINERPDLSNKFCPNPFDNFEPRETGLVGVCCLSWLPYYIGNINDNTVDEVYNSTEAQDIRKSILDGSFKYCDHRVCPYIQNGTLQNKDEVTDQRHRNIIANNQVVINHPTHVNFVHDDSCNLSCPSCRIKKINFSTGEIYEKRLKIHNRLIDSLFAKDLTDGCTLSITGSGDPFASKIFRDFLLEFDGRKYPNVKIDLQTNGVMFTPKMWDSIHKIHDNLNLVMVSFDAAVPDTYDVVRRDGDWDLLVENTKFLGQKRLENKMDMLRLDFVVQDLNYKEMPRFVDLARSFGGIDGIYFSMVTDWSTWDKDTFNQRAVWRMDHPECESFMEVLKSEQLQDRRFIDMSNLSSYFERANQ